MDLKELATHGNGTRHPWELARADFFTNTLAHLPTDPGPKRALDVGSGDTWLASRLLEHMPVNSSMVCVDSSYGPELIARLQKPGVRLLSSMPRGESFDLVFLLDVIEHVENPNIF